MQRFLRTASVAVSLGLSFVLPRTVAAQTSADSAKIREAAMNYIEGFYEGDSTKLMRAVRPEVYKYGYYRAPDSTSYRGMQMTWAGFMSYARNVKASGRPTPAAAVRGVKLLDVLDQTAAVKVTATWGNDYLLLAKYGNEWQITHVNWQSAPRK